MASLEFNPDLTPEQMKRLGVLAGRYNDKNPKEANYFHVDASMKDWPETWKRDSAPMGWFDWYQQYHSGVRSEDDERQIKRWRSFKARHLAQLKKADPTLMDLSVQPRRRQALLNWGIAPGIDQKEYTNPYLEKAASMHQRAKYNADLRHYEKMEEPAGSIKYDGANYFVHYDKNGVPSFISRRPSVSGEYLDRTSKVPHLAKVLPEEAGHVYNVELIHTGFDPKAKESHPKVSGILNSLAPKAIATQQEIGPVRAVVFNMMNADNLTYKEKIDKMHSYVKNFGDESLLFQPEHHYGREAIAKLVEATKASRREGVIVHDLNKPESNNTRLKIKHVNHYNLRVSGIEQEYDINGNPKQSAGALTLVDATGRDVGKVGTGFDRATRIDIWENPDKWIGRLIQVEAMDSVAHKLRSAVYNGDADGNIDEV